MVNIYLDKIKKKLNLPLDLPIEIRYCESWEQAKSINNYTDGYIICIPKGADKYTLLQLCHEMVHVKQWYERRLIHCAWVPVVEFCGKAYEVSSMPHKELPWEREAIIESHYLCAELLKGV